jgi:hypothetical protein
MIERTPTEFRSTYNEWRKTAPPNDSDIFSSKPRRSAKPRHDDLSKELQGLLFWRHVNCDVQPLSTNWMMFDNDNGSDREDDEPRAPMRSTECEHVIRPSEDKLMAAVEEVEFETRIYNHKVPIPGPNVEFGEPYKACPPLNGYVRPIARLGTIRFATKDSVGAGQNISPTRGSIVGRNAEPNTWGFPPVDDFGAPFGSDEEQEDIDSSNQFFADLLNAQPHRYITGERSRQRKSINSFLTNDDRPALPCGSRRVSDSFIGHKITSSGDDYRTDQSADEWIVRTQERSDIRAKLSPDDTKALDTAIHASNYRDVGEAFGFRGKTAERRGKSLLLAASKSLSTLIDKAAA